MGFSTFGSKPHLAKKRKRDGPPSADSTASNSLPPVSQREGVEVNLDVDMGTQINKNDEDGDRRIMEPGNEDADGGEYRSNGHEDIGKEAGNEHMVIVTSVSAQTSSLISERLMRLTERGTFPAAPTLGAVTSPAIHDAVGSSCNTTPALTSTKATPMTGSDSSYNFAPLRHGVRDQNGDVAYYDHSFVEDPWKDLR